MWEGGALRLREVVVSPDGTNRHQDLIKTRQLEMETRARLKIKSGLEPRTKLERCSTSAKDTEDQGDHGAQRQRHPDVSHPVVQGGDGQAVRQHTLQTHKEQAGREGHPRPHVVQRLGMVHLVGGWAGGRARAHTHTEHNHTHTPRAQPHCCQQ